MFIIIGTYNYSSCKHLLCYSLIVASSAKQIKYCIEYMIACVVLKSNTTSFPVFVNKSIR